MTARAIGLSVVIPVYNGERVLAHTIGLLSAYLTTGQSEIIIVENGSSDGTLEVARANAVDTQNVTFHVLQSDKGMGNAYRRGIQASSGQRILLTADDLPFGIGDLEQDAELMPKPPVVIGSKAHKNSITPRGLTRNISSLGFRILRKVLLGSKVGDSQGTLIVDGDWLRKMVDRFDDPGFLFSTQVVFAAEQQGMAIVEVPVILAPDEQPTETTIKLGDIVKMARGLLALRSRRSDFGSTPEGLPTL
ncbi:glycosyltransferase [Pseudarthrobacter sp. RMG13]|uniref:Glycosyltransferase n=1 Tax=Pseudarthrobacter humi TaxID=2952523 RepID=A0ABT1LJQ3_9MICC|nr:glycosyltransferase [Pseudarthrobacter humi]MCP8998668.1 glycosyltransferase [Pseudarthrobacter humi]